MSKKPIPATAAPSTQTPSRTNEPWFEITQDAEGKWHWQLWSGNGRAIATNAEPYDTKKHLLQAIKTMPGILATVNVIAKSHKDE